jgi:transcriptional regulator with XRE-family HTH domain
MSRQAARQTVTPPEVRKLVARRIREAQLAKKAVDPDLNNAELARRIGVQVRLVLKWRRGDVIPSWANLVRLGQELDRPVDWFFSEDGAEAA